MNRKWLWAGLLAVPLVIGGGLAVAATQITSFTCPLSGKVISWQDCCPFSTHSTSEESCPTCPSSTTEQPPCESCCQTGD